jgi:hypothetical protein
MPVPCPKTKISVYVQPALLNEIKEITNDQYGSMTRVFNESLKMWVEKNSKQPQKV